MRSRLGGVTARQFYGMDINPFAVELAKVTMVIARKLAIDGLHMDEQALPLDNLDDNFRACEALIFDTRGATDKAAVGLVSKRQGPDTDKLRRLRLSVPLHAVNLS